MFWNATFFISFRDVSTRRSHPTNKTRRSCTNTRSRNAPSLEKPSDMKGVRRLWRKHGENNQLNVVDARMQKGQDGVTSQHSSRLRGIQAHDIAEFWWLQHTWHGCPY